MEYVNRYVRSQSCRIKCGDDDKGQSLYPPDLELVEDAPFTRDCGCVYDVVRDRVMDPNNLAFKIKYYLVSPRDQEEHDGYFYLMFHGKQYRADVPIIMPLCCSCADIQENYSRMGQEFLVEAHFHYSETATFPPEALPEAVYKRDRDLSNDFKLLCRSNTPSCNECKEPLYKLEICTCDVETEIGDNDSIVMDDNDFWIESDVDFSFVNNRSPSPSFMVTDKGHSALDYDACELNYLVSLYQTTRDDSYSPTDDDCFD
nr:MAG: hypothetical protein [Bee densovirus 8]